MAHHAHAARRLACVSALLVVLGLAACGSDSSSTASQRQQQPNGQRGFSFLQDPKVRACLQKQGVTLPTGRRGQNGAPPGGQPQNGQRPNRDSEQFEKLRAALQKCGVTLPQGGGNGGPPPAEGTTTSSAS